MLSLTKQKKISNALDKNILNLVINFVTILSIFQQYKTSLFFIKDLYYVLFDYKNINTKIKWVIKFDFSRKQVFLTKNSLSGKPSLTLSNGVILKKLNNQSQTNQKKSFFLKNDFLKILFDKILILKNKSTVLILNGYTGDLVSFWQKIDKLGLFYYFTDIILNFNNNYNLSKKKRLRSIKKRFKKSFLKNENKNLKNYINYN